MSQSQLDSQLDYYLDEMHVTSSYSYTCHLDDEIYARRDTSYETLAYKHYA